MQVNEEFLVNFFMAGGALLLGVGFAIFVTGVIEWIKERIRWK